MILGYYMFSGTDLALWAVAVTFIIIYIFNDLLKKYKSKIEELNNKEKERLKNAETDFNIKKAELETTIAETKKKAIEWGLLELEKFKADELQKLKAEIMENAERYARLLTAKWVEENEDRIRKDAANRSVRNVMGRVTEQLLPFSEAMSMFNPKDARFIGSPIDLVVFDGAEEMRDNINIVFIEVKTGTSALSKRQKLIKDAIENGRVEWKRVNMKNFGDDVEDALKEQS